MCGAKILNSRAAGGDRIARVVWGYQWVVQDNIVVRCTPNAKNSAVVLKQIPGKWDLLSERDDIRRRHSNNSVDSASIDESAVGGFHVLLEIALIGHIDTAVAPR